MVTAKKISKKIYTKGNEKSQIIHDQKKKSIKHKKS